MILTQPIQCSRSTVLFAAVWFVASVIFGQFAQYYLHRVDCWPEYTPPVFSETDSAGDNRRWVESVNRKNIALSRLDISLRAFSGSETVLLHRYLMVEYDPSRPFIIDPEHNPGWKRWIAEQELKRRLFEEDFAKCRFILATVKDANGAGKMKWVIIGERPEKRRFFRGPLTDAQANQLWPMILKWNENA